MKYCCALFQELVGSAGERGPSIVVIDGGKHGRYLFFIQGRATDSSQPFLEITSYPVTLVSTINIAYCPSCGANLGKFYAHISLILHPELAKNMNDLLH